MLHTTGGYPLSRYSHLSTDATTAPERAPSCERTGRRIPHPLYSEPGGGNRFRYSKHITLRVQMPVNGAKS